MRDARPALEAATRTPSIMDLKMFPWDRKTPRFYLPGEHPATYRLRCHRDRIAALLSADPMARFTAPEAYRGCCDALAYVEQQLAAFEAGEDEAKRIAWSRLRDHYAPRHPENPDGRDAR